MSLNNQLELKYNLDFLEKDLHEYRDLSLAARDILQNALRAGTCDLHIHTSSSDGSDSVGEIMETAMHNELCAFSITDYDTMAAVDNMMIIVDKMLQMGVPIPRFIRGLEISSAWNKHKQNLLAYFPLEGTGMIQSFLEDQRQRRRSRNIRMCERLQACGLPITIEELEAEGPYVVGRLHAANLLIRKGIVMTQAEAFSEWLDEGRSAYVPYDLPRLEDCIRLVRGANGVPVLSKPYKYNWLDLTDDEITDKLIYLRQIGLLGVEVVFSGMLEKDMERLAVSTKKAGLMATCGSGYSGYYRSKADMFKNGQDFSRWLLL